MTDQFDPGYRMLVVACKSDKRWFDLDAVRTEPVVPQEVHDRWDKNTKVTKHAGLYGGRPGGDSRGGPHISGSNPAGAPPLDYWLIDTQAGVERVLKSMLPERVCKVCGEPSRRITEASYEPHGVRVEEAKSTRWVGIGNPENHLHAQAMPHGRATKHVETTGWTDCGHNNYRAGVTLDPFDLTTEGTNMGEARYIIGDVFDTLATLEDNSVDLVFSSPPFLALRSYLPADHPDKAKEIGSEATPADFLDTLLDVVEACDRVLAPHGSLVFELGDTFAGSGGAGGDYNEGGFRDGQPKAEGSAMKHNRVAGEGMAHPIRNMDYKVQPGGMGWPLPKSLCGIPTLFAWSLAYGRNLLRPERETPRWRIRNLIVWARPNPPVGALGDKMRPATSYLTVACKSDKRWFDLDAVREAHKIAPGDRAVQERSAAIPSARAGVGQRFDGKASGDGFVNAGNPAGAPPLDYWEIPTHPFPGAHYATFPPALCVKPIASMCPAKVCRVCGEPSRRIVGDVSYVGTSGARVGQDLTDHAKWWPAGTGTPKGNDKYAEDGGPRSDGNMSRSVETLGWTDCGHDDYRTGVTLDPFAGSGTTLAVATGHGRDAIGIDLDARNFELARERVGPMFLPDPEFVGEPFQFPKVEDVQTDAEVL